MHKFRILNSVAFFIFLSFFCLYVYAAEDLTFNIPAPPNALLLTNDAGLEAKKATTMSSYSSDDDPAAIAGFYRAFFREQGFQNITDRLDADTNQASLIYNKDDLGVIILITVKSNKAEVMVMKYLISAMASSMKGKLSLKDMSDNLPKKDASGQDISAVPRPPASVRILSRNNGSGPTVTYTVSLGIEEVVGFYKKEMPGREWELVSETPLSKNFGGDISEGKSFSAGGMDIKQIISSGYVLEFSASFGSAEITVLPNFSDTKPGSIVQIAYREKQQ